MNYREKLNKAIGKRDLIQKTIIDKKQKKEKGEKRAIHIEEAQAVVQLVAQQTQQKLRYHITDIVQLALDAVFPGKYLFDFDFEIKRGQTEAYIGFLKDGEKINPMDASGGGVCDVAAFALRIAAWSISNTRNVMVLDEPGKFISRDLIQKFALIVEELSERLNLQFIIVSHIPELAEMGDKTFKIRLVNEVSQIEEIT